jgi:hypothetical protein
MATWLVLIASAVVGVLLMRLLGRTEEPPPEPPKDISA